ncbi:MAG: radical SAM protein [Hyphomicrobiaceae bacterium]
MATLAAHLNSIEALDGLAFDHELAAELWQTGQHWQEKPLLASTPSFKTYVSDELTLSSSGPKKTEGPGAVLPGGREAGLARDASATTPTACSSSSGAFPAFSITGGSCALACEHCGGRILEPMIATGPPDAFERTVHAMHERQGLRGFLLSGGSNLRNEVPFERYLPAVKRLKSAIPTLEVAVHTGLVDARRAARLADADVDVAMLDIIGAPETIREVYRLDRPVADFEASLAYLIAAGLDVVPHIVIGLHFGRLLGEETAISIIARHPTRAVIAVVLMPHLAVAGRFETPVESDVARTLLAARRRLADRTLLLGCARPAGRHRALTDAYAVLAGVDGIAYPADGALALARTLGRVPGRSSSCCGIDRCRPAA